MLLGSDVHRQRFSSAACKQRFSSAAQSLLTGSALAALQNFNEALPVGSDWAALRQRCHMLTEDTMYHAPPKLAVVALNGETRHPVVDDDGIVRGT